MIMQRIKFRSTLSQEELWKVAREREPEYRRMPGLLQKFYIQFNEPDTYGGVMIWDSMEALAAFRETTLAKTIGQAYQVDGPPEIEVGSVEIMLREAVMVDA